MVKNSESYINNLFTAKKGTDTSLAAQQGLELGKHALVESSQTVNQSEQMGAKVIDLVKRQAWRSDLIRLATKLREAANRAGDYQLQSEVDQVLDPQVIDVLGQIELVSVPLAKRGDIIGIENALINEHPAQIEPKQSISQLLEVADRLEQLGRD